MRVFKYANSNYMNLLNNPAHNFCLKQTARIYRSNSLYTWIPKNACSTMRFSVAKANGCIKGLEDLNWIHSNNISFNATTETAAVSGYTFVILRCPFSRLLSAFMDKIVGSTPQGWLFRQTCKYSFDLHDLTFKQFIDEICTQPLQQLNVHWHPQTNFLLFDEYDDYFSYEKLADAIPIIEEKTGIEIIDTRAALGHDIASIKGVLQEPEPYNIAAFDLLVHKKAGRVPAPEAMFDADIIAKIRQKFAPDFQLYESKFGKSQLMKVLY